MRGNKMMTWGQPRLMNQIRENLDECKSRIFDLVIEQTEVKKDRFLVYMELHNVVKDQIDGIIENSIMLSIHIMLLQKIEPDRFRRIG